MAFTKVVGAGIHTLSNITSHNINSSGIITATKFVGPIEGDITAVDATFTGNVSIAKTLTYEDVTNVDSVGLGTFRQGIFLPDNKQAKFGNTAASPDFKIYSDGTNGILYAQNNPLYIKGQQVIIQSNNNEMSGWFTLNGGVKLYYDGSAQPKFETTSSGVSIGGTTIITSASGGKLGIGTDNPTKLLELKGTDPTIKLWDSSGDAYALLEGDSDDQGSLRFRADPLSAGANTHIRFDTDGTERLRITSTGQIITNGNANPFPTRGLTIRPNASQTNNYLSIIAGNTSSVSGVTFGTSADNNANNYRAMFEYYHSGFAHNEGLRFLAAGTEALRIRGGTSNAGDILYGPGDHVVGASPGLINGLGSHNNANPASVLYGIDDGGGYNGMKVINFDDGTYNSQRIEFLTGKGGVSMATVRMGIDENGLVSIGRTISANSSFNSSTNQLVVGNGVGHQGMVVYTGASHAGTIIFNDVADGTFQGAISYKHGSGTSDNSLRFTTNTSERLRITSGGDVSISGDGSVHGISKLTIKPANRTTAFSASDGDTWHDVVIKHEGDAQTNAVGLAFEVSGDAYHKNAGTGIAAVKQGTASDYGSDLVFITRGQSTAATEKLRITSDGQVLIGTTAAPSGANTKLRVHFPQNTSSGEAIEISHDTNGADKVGAALGLAIANGGASTNAADLYFRTASGGSTDERLRITSDGKVLIGHNASRYVAGGHAILQVQNATSEGAHFIRTSNDDGAIVLALAKSRSSAGAACIAGDRIGTLGWYPHDGTDCNHAAAEIFTEVATGIGGNDVPGDLVFQTNGGTTTTTERLRITSTGAVAISGNRNQVAPAVYNDLTGTNQAAVIVGSSGITDAGIVFRTSTTGTGRIYFGDNSGSDAGRKQGRIEYYNNGDYMLLGANGVGESLRITGGAAEQATLVINNTNTNGNTWIGDNYTASATEHTCTIGNMYSGAGFFAGYGLKPKSDAWGFVSSTDAYADRKAAITLGGSGYDAFRVDAHNSSTQATTGADVTTAKVFGVDHGGNVSMNQNGGYLKAHVNHSAGNDGTIARGRLKQWYASDLSPSIDSSSSGWYPIMDISDGQYLFMIGTSAHNSATCLVCNGYDPSAVSRINVLQCVRNNNGNYLNIEQIRVLNNGVVEVYLYAGNPQYFQMWVQVLSDREMPTFYTTLTKNTGSPTVDDSKDWHSYSNSVGAGLMHVENIRIDGTLSKGGGTFTIPHPLASKKDTHHLNHSFIEGPQCDNIYRGKVTLSSGAATVNLDTVSNMTEGTFVLLNRDVQCFTTNETGWGAIKGSVSGNILTISAQDNSSTDTISWMVVGERQDDTIKASNLTDDNGNLIVEKDVSRRDDLTDSTPPS